MLDMSSKGSDRAVPDGLLDKLGLKSLQTVLKNKSFAMVMSAAAIAK